jgi:ribose 5-phosphate isomerase B
MRIAFGGDDKGNPLHEVVITRLRTLGHEVVEVADGEPWPEVARRVGESVASGAADRGVTVCYTGTGVSIAANKVAGVRAALCTDAETAEGARKWNDANVLALGYRLTTDELAREMVDAFLTTEPDPSEQTNIRRLG